MRMGFLVVVLKEIRHKPVFVAKMKMIISLFTKIAIESLFMSNDSKVNFQEDAKHNPSVHNLKLLKETRNQLKDKRSSLSPLHEFFLTLVFSRYVCYLYFIESAT